MLFEVTEQDVRIIKSDDSSFLVLRSYSKK